MSIKVLVAEDTEMNQRVYARLFQALGCAVTIVADGAAAVASASADKFDIIFLDVQMPVLDGIGAAQQIRALQQAGSIATTPMVAMTGNSMAGDAEICRQAGIVDFLPKPIELDGLVRILKKHTNYQRG